MKSCQLVYFTRTAYQWHSTALYIKSTGCLVLLVYTKYQAPELIKNYAPHRASGILDGCVQQSTRCVMRNQRPQILQHIWLQFHHHCIFFNEYLEHHDEWKFQPVHLLWALCFMKTYLTYDVLCNWLSVRCHKTLKKWEWRVINVLQAIDNLVS